jgi:competence ComEA-like helix-hairpin-helix protein
VLWIGLAVLVLIVVIASLVPPPKVRSLEKGSRLVNINTATAAELESLPGIGPSLAQLVIAGRPYKDVADLARIRGISERQVEQLRPMLRVSEPTRDLRAVSVRERIAAWAAALSFSAGRLRHRRSRRQFLGLPVAAEDAAPMAECPHPGRVRGRETQALGRAQARVTRPRNRYD